MSVNIYFFDNANDLKCICTWNQNLNHLRERVLIKLSSQVKQQFWINFLYPPDTKVASNYNTGCTVYCLWKKVINQLLLFIRL